MVTKSKQTGFAGTIDVGSHEISLLVAEMQQEKAPKIVEIARRTLSIGTDTYKDGLISRQLLDQLIAILNSFHAKLLEYGDPSVEVVATSAFREAKNAIYCVEQIEKRTGFKVRILSRNLETSLHLLGLSATLPDYSSILEEATLILDIRAGSIQLTLYDQGRLINSLNFRIGALRVRELLADFERRAIDYSALLEEYIGGDLRYYDTLAPKRTTYKHLIVIGGSVRFLRHYVGLAPGEIALQKDVFSAACIKLGKDDRKGGRNSEIPVDHRNLLLPTAIIIDQVMQFAGVESFYIPELSLCECLAIDLAVRKYRLSLPYDVEADLVSASRQLARRYRTDKFHGSAVERLSLRLFDLTKKIHGLGRQERLCLQMAAMLHNIGKYISIAGDGLHTLGIIESNDFVGLSPDDQRLVALLACFHNGNVSIEDYRVRQLPVPRRLVLMKLIALLAFANALDAGHRGKISLIKAKLTDNKLVLTYESDGDETLELWTAKNSSKPMLDVFGLEPVLVKARRRAGGAKA